MGADIERSGEMLQLPRAAGGDHGDAHRSGDRLSERKVVAVPSAVGIHRGQQDLPRSELLQSHRPLHGFDSRRLTPAPDHDLPPPVPLRPSPLPPLRVHGGDHALSAELVGQSSDEGRVSDCCRIDGHLVGPRP